MEFFAEIVNDYKTIKRIRKNVRPKYFAGVLIMPLHSVTYSELCHTSKMERFVKIDKCFEPLTVFSKMLYLLYLTGLWIRLNACTQIFQIFIACFKGLRKFVEKIEFNFSRYIGNWIRESQRYVSNLIRKFPDAFNNKRPLNSFTKLPENTCNGMVHQNAF